MSDATLDEWKILNDLAMLSQSLKWHKAKALQLFKGFTWKAR